IPMNEISSELISRYSRIFREKDDQPAWAVHKTTAPEKLLHCTIPFVGKDYAAQKKRILLYASAENMSKDRYDPRLNDDTIAVDRHRYWFGLTAGSQFFPNVHIQPMTDGGLVIAARYLANRLGCCPADTPAAFLEQIAFGNYCKYTISSGTNMDYAGDRKKLAESHAYIRADIETLRPDIIILPKTICRADIDFLNSIRGDAVLIPIFQINARNINCGIFPKYSSLPSRADEVTFRWTAQLGISPRSPLTGKTKEHFPAVFPYLDEVIEKI
ncbi:MAG: hypothetical protein IJD13_06850, partial [Oscillospiraceae bacterium]|nr:hypothetical protein [Oscillospiraceae bacterium]